MQLVLPFQHLLNKSEKVQPTVDPIRLRRKEGWSDCRDALLREVSDGELVALLGHPFLPDVLPDESQLPIVGPAQTVHHHQEWLVTLDAEPEHF